MGKFMATGLLQAGYPLAACNRSRIADSPAEEVRYADMSLLGLRLPQVA